MRREIVQSFQKTRARACQNILDEFRPLWRENRRHEQDERARLARDEQTVIGRARSAVRAIRNWRSTFEGDPLKAATSLWNGLFSAEARKRLLEQQQAQRRLGIENRQRLAIRQAIVPVHAEHRLRLYSCAKAFQAERSSLVLAHSADRAKLRAQWSSLRQERTQAYAQLRAAHEQRQAFTQAASLESYLDRLKAMASAERGRAREQDNRRERGRGQERE